MLHTVCASDLIPAIAVTGICQVKRVVMSHTTSDTVSKAAYLASHNTAQSLSMPSMIVRVCRAHLGLARPGRC